MSLNMCVPKNNLKFWKRNVHVHIVSNTIHKFCNNTTPIILHKFMLVAAWQRGSYCVLSVVFRHIHLIEVLFIIMYCAFQLCQITIIIQHNNF